MDEHPTEKILVTLPVTETPEQRKERVKQRKALPTYSFMVSGNVTTKGKNDAPRKN